ncbi:hypothetical protein [Singulisphaera sp. PoT]|uniref:hypothetical protein n=1 Tax=Singulisphaera sp. PoT TaxID=3411797 RepID=UPI003BF59AB1
MIMYVVYAALMAAFLVLARRLLYVYRFLSSRKHACPRCGKERSLRREPRRKFDRYISQFVDSRRYKCLVCRWSGLLRQGPDDELDHWAD